MATSYRYPSGAVEQVHFVKLSDAFVADGADNAVESKITQPANTIIKDISIVVVEAPTIVVNAASDLGYKVGTDTSTSYANGSDDLAEDANGLIDAASATGSLAAGAVKSVYSFASSTAGATMAINDAYTASDRTLFMNTLTTSEADPAAGAGGTILWVVTFTMLPA